MKRASKTEQERPAEQPLVAILMGSDSDWPVMAAAADRLAELGIPHQAHVLSAHRSPENTARFARAARAKGYRVLICGAGAAAHLAGAVAAQTTLPVLGVPLDSGGMGGLDALLATVQMPAGVPVATLAVGRAGADNAAILAAQIIAVGDARIAKRLDELKTALARAVENKDRRLQQTRLAKENLAVGAARSRPARGRVRGRRSSER